MNEVWIINGIPGAGKSATARALAARQPRGVHIEGDALQKFIVSGSVAPGEAPPWEEDRQIHLNVHNQCLLARSFAREDFVPFLDYVIVNRERVEEYRRHLAGFSLHLVTLVPGIKTALERDQKRPEKTVAPQWTHLDQIMRTQLSGIGLSIDNAALSLDETVSRILEHKAAAKL